MSKHTDTLLDAVQSIAEIIYMEMPLRYQDAWLDDIMNKGMWKPDPEIVEGAKAVIEKYGKDAWKEVGVCCRNGCEKCEQ